jgi:hypothetical protein
MFYYSNCLRNFIPFRLENPHPYDNRAQEHERGDPGEENLLMESSRLTVSNTYRNNARLNPCGKNDPELDVDESICIKYTEP